VSGKNELGTEKNAAFKILIIPLLQNSSTPKICYNLSIGAIKLRYSIDVELV
jgi:hypothetical protein